MTVQAKMIDDATMAVTLGGFTREFKAHPGRDGMVADYVFAAPVVRNGKDWPVSVTIADSDGIAKVYYPSGLTINRGGIRITGFWADSTNQSKHNKV